MPETSNWVAEIFRREADKLTARVACQGILQNSSHLAPAHVFATRFARSQISSTFWTTTVRCLTAAMTCWVNWFALTDKLVPTQSSKALNGVHVASPRWPPSRIDWHSQLATNFSQRQSKVLLLAPFPMELPSDGWPSSTPTLATLTLRFFSCDCLVSWSRGQLVKICDSIIFSTVQLGHLNR